MASEAWWSGLSIREKAALVLGLDQSLAIAATSIRQTIGELLERIGPASRAAMAAFASGSTTRSGVEAIEAAFDNVAEAFFAAPPCAPEEIEAGTQFFVDREAEPDSAAPIRRWSSGGAAALKRLAEKPEIRGAD